MYFTDDSLLPENQPPLMITAAPYGPMWMPQDCTPEQKLPVTWDEQVQVAKDCYNAGATLLHIHVRDPKTAHISKKFSEYSEQVGRLRKLRSRKRLVPRVQPRGKQAEPCLNSLRPRRWMKFRWVRAKPS
jgi:hypothetical protein